MITLLVVENSTFFLTLTEDIGRTCEWISTYLLPFYLIDKAEGSLNFTIDFVSNLESFW